jgi:SAM-dependent methyltransferase
MRTYQQHPSSFRDPSGFVFESAGKLYRQINLSYARHYESLMSSGLYHLLTTQGWMISHQEVESDTNASSARFKTIMPQFIPFITYPYEWIFEQLQDAALLTLKVMKTAMDHNMILKDATPYNIQFVGAQAVFIDTLSFENYDQLQPWIAYRQFCETFYFPLLVEQYTGLEIHKVFAAYPEGIDASTTASLLPGKARFNIGNWLHVYLSASFSGKERQSKIEFNRRKLERIMQDLHQRITSLKPRTKSKSHWKNYYAESILNNKYLSHKQEVISGLLRKIDPHSAIDLGCNEGIFSKMLAKSVSMVVAVDSDAPSVSNLYSEAKKDRLNIIPLCVDLANPPGDAGFYNSERKSFTNRISFDLVLALALVHHLCIGKNLPLEKVADFLSLTRRWLIIEYVPPGDEKVLELARNKPALLDDYTEDTFLRSFQRYFTVTDEQAIRGSERKLFLLDKK